MRLAALSIDLDETSCYTAVHGLPDAPEGARWAIYQRALPRIERLLNQRGLRATFFVVGSDLGSPIAQEAVARLHRSGHEIGNHSQGHCYDLTRLPEAEIEYQIDACSNAIAGITGARPIGFRAPGYTINEQVLDTLQALDLVYDSSVFPCPAYYLAKGAKLASMRFEGRSSHSILDDPRVLTSPANPYRVGQNYRRRGSGILELPIGVTRNRTGRLPYIGTSLVLAGPKGSRWLTRAIVGRPLVNLELHGIDLACSDTDGLSFLRPHQPDLRVPLAQKQTTIAGAIDLLIKRGYRFVTLAEATAHFGRARRPQAFD